MNLEALYSKYYKYLINFINFKYEGRVSSEDAVQEAFLTYLVGNFKEVENPIALLMKITARRAHDIYYQRRFYKNGTQLRQIYLEELHQDDDDGWDPLFVDPNTVEEIDTYPQHDIRMAYLKKAINTLPRMQRKIMEYKLRNLTYKQIGRYTDKTESAARNATLKAIKMTQEKCMRHLRMTKKFKVTA